MATTKIACGGSTPLLSSTASFRDFGVRLPPQGATVTLAFSTSTTDGGAGCSARINVSLQVRTSCRSVCGSRVCSAAYQTDCLGFTAPPSTTTQQLVVTATATAITTSGKVTSGETTTSTPLVDTFAIVAQGQVYISSTVIVPGKVERFPIFLLVSTSISGDPTLFLAAALRWSELDPPSDWKVLLLTLGDPRRSKSLRSERVRHTWSALWLHIQRH